MICQDIQREHKQLNILLMVAHWYDIVLDREIATLMEEKEFCQSTKDVLMK